MAITLPSLPYAKNALEPYISARTLEFHYGKHHNAYVVNANKLLAGTELENENLETIIIKVTGDESRTSIFNNTAQVWNHSFYWNCMKPDGGGMPKGDISNGIKDAFGSYKRFIDEFMAVGTSQFGSGWAWLVQDGKTLKVMKTSNADTPLRQGLKPLLTVDVWEHAYYLDYQNRRQEYLTTFIEYLINWEFVNSCLEK